VWFASSLINPLAQLRIYVSSPSVACNWHSGSGANLLPNTPIFPSQSPLSLGLVQ
jgi:hypothetical protein